MPGPIGAKSAEAVDYFFRMLSDDEMLPMARVGVEFLNVSGLTRYMRVASLAEVEVIARGEGGVACTVPGPPAALQSRVAGSRVSLSWQSPTGAPPDAHVVEAGSASRLANLATLPLAGSATSFATDAPPGRYFVRVRAASACGVSPPAPAG